MIENLCNQHHMTPPRIEFPGPSGGINHLLDGIPDRIKAPGLEVLGIVVDADTNLDTRWQSLRDRLQNRDKLEEFAYEDLPPAPPATGWISQNPALPRIGIWLMPDNQRAGILEDFVVGLIPHNDALLLKARSVLLELEAERIHRYTEVNRPKALIYTWLAWQREPGRPMGQAVAHHAVPHDTPSAHAFVAWLRRLFDPTSSFMVV